MKTQISIQVQNENVISRCFSFYSLFGLLLKAKVNMNVDNTASKPIVLKARKEPYVFDLNPGEHVITFKAKNKGNFEKILFGAAFGLIGLGMGNSSTAMMGAKGGSDFVSGLMGHNRVQDNLLECNLSEGDFLKISVRPKRNGAVKIKLL